MANKNTGTIEIQTLHKHRERNSATLKSDPKVVEDSF
jgi:hypothetical protein